MTPGSETPGSNRIPVEKRLVLINGAASVLGHLVNLGLLIWLQRYLLHNIPVEEYAVYLLVVAPMLLVPLILGALSSAVGRFVVLRLSEQDEEGVSQVVSTTVVLSCVLAALLTVPAAGLYVWMQPVLLIDPDYVEDAQLMFALLYALTVVRVVASPLVVGPFVRQMFVVESLLSLGTQLLRLTCIVALLLLIEVHVLWVVVGTVVAESLGVAASVLVSCRLVPALRFRLRYVSRSAAPVLAAFGGWSFLKNLPVVIRRAGEPVLLNRMAGALDVTCFHLGSLVLTQLQFLMNHVVYPLQPPLVALHARGDHERIRAVYLRVNRIALLLALFVAVPAVLYQRELVVLYVGERFLDAGLAMALLVVQLPIRWCSIMTGPLSTALNRLRPMALVSGLVNLGTLAAIGVVLALGYGAVEAAAVSLAVTLLVQPALLWPLGWRLAGVSASTWLKECVLPSALPVSTGLVVWFALRTTVAPDTWLSLFGCFAGGAAVYLGTLLLFSTTGEDRQDLRASWGALARVLTPTASRE